MRRTARYSSSTRPPPEPTVPAPEGTSVPAHADAVKASASVARTSAGNNLPLTNTVTRTHLVWLLAALVLGLIAMALWPLQRTAQRQLTQDDIDAAVLHTLTNKTMPSPAARAVAQVAPSVVRVVGYSKVKGVKGPPGKGSPRLPGKTDRADKTDKDDKAAAGDGEVETGVGTGVVIVDTGIILTNMHVVAGADTIRVTFSDGLQATATVTGVQPEHDLAVLQAHKIPDDLAAATMRSTADLRPGDMVAAVGFPFGIGPSASAGVVSGLKREFESPDGKRPLSNLIQFDAAANPGNSGGPLITMDGEVVGIVTAILNPTRQRTFIGIGFAVPIENAASAAGMPPF